MNRWTLIYRSLRYYARSYWGTLAGAAIGSMVLVGALVVGDSVRGSLREMALSRLGKVHLALASGDRLFQARLAEAVGRELSASAAALLHLPGTANRSDGVARANRVNVLGVDPGFWSMAGQTPPGGPLADDQVMLNEVLARQLQAQPGDVLVFRLSRPAELSRDAPLSPEEDSMVAWRLTVRQIVSDTELGRFSLRASQVPPFNAFVSRTALAARLDLSDPANLLVVAHGPGPGSTEVAAGDVGLTPEAGAEALQRVWTLADAQLELRPSTNASVLELRSRRVFLDVPVGEVAWEVDPEAYGVFTYFVNALELGERRTPYSMVSAVGPPLVPDNLGQDEILITQWLADDLQASVDDELELSYFVVGLGRALEERTTRLRVASIEPMDGPAVDPSLMPDFPGLTDADNCRDWDAGFPIDTARIREKDEAYWDQYRGTPKALLSLGAGQRLWGNRFGNLTGVRFPMNLDSEGAGSAWEPRQRELASALLSRLKPSDVGLQFEPVREQALAAASQSQDFAGLFVGFSFFLIAAAMLLTALLFQFGIEQRATEIGTLLALGFTPRRVRWLLLLEGGAIALIGALIGVFGGVKYAQAMLHGLSTIWRDAVGTSSLGYHTQPMTLVLGLLLGTCVAWFTMLWAIRRQARQPARVLLSGVAPGDEHPKRGVTRRGGFSLVVASVSGVAAVALLVAAIARGDTAAGGVFFGAGALLLISGLAGCAYGLTRLARSTDQRTLTLGRLAVRGCTRRRHRSLGTLGLLACGSFLIASIGVFRLDAVRDAERRSSGTGGFALLGESTLPIVHDLSQSEGRTWLSLNAEVSKDVGFVPMRVNDGEDASCLNLNRAQRPRLVGVKPSLLAERGAFTFAKVAPGFSVANAWALLDSSPSLALTNAVPGAEPVSEVHAIGDLNSVLWALGKQVGDTLEYTDERGRTVVIRIVAAVANSILQGNLLIDEAAFVRLFPSASGYRMFLIDAGSAETPSVAEELSRGLQDFGLEVTSTTERLAALNAVQNTYLGTFQVLGGLGLLLGSVGLGILVLRNVLERRSELAVLMALGFQRRTLRRFVVYEHTALLAAGLGLGVVAAMAAVLPALMSPGAPAFPVSLAFTLVAVVLNGLVWTWGAAAWILRGDLLPALRQE